MQALVLIDEIPEKIKIKELDKPRPGKDQALVKISAAALNRRDQWCRVGKYPNIQYGVTLGSDGAGVVVQVGDNVSKDWLNKAVIINPNINWGENPLVQSSEYKILGMPDNGTLAEYVCVNHDRLHEKPESLSFEEAAAIPLAGLTAYRALFTHGKVKENSQVLISGAGGGVAQFAMQFALAIGARVFVSTGSKDKVDFFQKFGLSGILNYKSADWLKNAKKLSGGFDTIIDSAGGEQAGELVKTLRPAGKYIFYGATNGLPGKIDFFRMFWNQTTIQGSTMGNDDEFKAMLDFVTSHKIVPIIGNTYDFKNVIEAFDSLDRGSHLGKVVVKL